MNYKLYRTVFSFGSHICNQEAAKIRVKHLNAGIKKQGLEGETGGEQLPGGQGEQQRHRCHQGRGRA
jgi:hypothetical protein